MILRIFFKFLYLFLYLVFKIIRKVIINYKSVKMKIIKLIYLETWKNQEYQLPLSKHGVMTKAS